MGKKIGKQIVIMSCYFPRFSVLIRKKVGMCAVQEMIHIHNTCT